MKPPVELADFQRLDLRVGTVTAVRPHPVLAGLSILTVRLNELVEALAPGSSATSLAPGSQAVVATGLHPLTVAGLRVTACLVAGPVTSQIPDGSRLS
jgi:tRNA-binding EMAP/Myf-like protein